MTSDGLVVMDTHSEISGWTSMVDFGRSQVLGCFDTLEIQKIWVEKSNYLIFLKTYLIKLNKLLFLNSVISVGRPTCDE